MKQILHVLFLFFLISCSTITTSIPPTVTVPSQTTFTQTATQIASSTSVPIPTIETATATIIPCDPKKDEFCIFEGHFIFERPIRPPANDIVDSTYPYGSTAKGARDPHHGVEFLNKFGTPVYATGDGTVIFAGPDEVAIYSPWINFYGDVVVIKHNNDLFTLYAHLSKIDIQEGQSVHIGDKIGEVGQSGVATGSHLHFEVRLADVEDYFSTVNPELWLAPNKDEKGVLLGTLMISIVDGNNNFLFSEFTVNYYLDQSQPPVKTYYVATYGRNLSTGEENAAVGNLAPGSYRIAFTMNGQLYERWVEVKSGRLTQVVFVVK